MKVKRILHKGYIEFVLAKEKGIDFDQYFGKYHYVYSEGKKEISLVKLKDCFKNSWFWEIAKLKGKGVDGDSIERFKTKKDADKRIKELMA